MQKHRQPTDDETRAPREPLPRFVSATRPILRNIQLPTAERLTGNVLFINVPLAQSGSLGFDNEANIPAVMRLKLRSQSHESPEEIKRIRSGQPLASLSPPLSLILSKKYPFKCQLNDDLDRFSVESMLEICHS